MSTKHMTYSRPDARDSSWEQHWHDRLAPAERSAIRRFAYMGGFIPHELMPWARSYGFRAARIHLIAWKAWALLTLPIRP